MTGFFDARSELAQRHFQRLRSDSGRGMPKCRPGTNAEMPARHQCRNAGPAPMPKCRPGTGLLGYFGGGRGPGGWR
jgi:hypothetical protein